MASLPRDWSVLGSRLKAWRPPQDQLAPVETWSLRYVRHELIPERDGKPGGGESGSLLIKQKIVDGVCGLYVTESVRAGFTNMTVEADIICSHDLLRTPRRWTIRHHWQAGALAKIRPGELDQESCGTTDGLEIVVRSRREHRRPVPQRWTSLWNLFSVLPHLPFEAASVLTFDLFEEMDLHKPGQLLAYAGRQTVLLNGQNHDLHVFEQTGCGMLPWHWWLDAQHRILLAAGGRRAYLLDSTVKGGTE